MAREKVYQRAQRESAVASMLLRLATCVLWAARCREIPEPILPQCSFFRLSASARRLPSHRAMGAGASALPDFVSTSTAELLEQMPQDVAEELDELRSELEALRLQEQKMAGEASSWHGHASVKVPSVTRHARGRTSGRSRSPIWSGCCDATEQFFDSLPADAQGEINVLRAELDALRIRKGAGEFDTLVVDPTPATTDAFND